MNLTDRDERSAAAGEYVLGTLDAAARAEFEQALAADAALRAEVYAWQDRLLGLARHAAPVEPLASLWPAIESRLPASPVAARLSAAAPAANDALWRRLRRWQWTGGLAVAASVLLAGLLLLRPPLPPAGDGAVRYLTLLQGPDQATGWLVEARAGGSVRLLPVGATPPLPAGKVLQFWTKEEGAAGPTSLGLVAPGEAVELPASRLPGLSERQLFELTLEPAGGSTIGKPTGPIWFVGRSIRL